MQIVPFIQKCHSGKDVPVDLIFQCIGIICVNAIGFNFDKNGSNGSKQGRALYATAVLASHNCLRNTIHRIDATNFWYVKNFGKKSSICPFHFEGLLIFRIQMTACKPIK